MINSIPEKTAATLPAAICKQLQLLQTYVDVTHYLYQ